MRGILDIFPIAMFYNNKDLHSRKMLQHMWKFNSIAKYNKDFCVFIDF